MFENIVKREEVLRIILILVKSNHIKQAVEKGREDGVGDDLTFKVLASSI